MSESRVKATTRQPATAPELYLRLHDPLQPVYEIDRGRQEVRLAGSRIGGGFSWPLRDGGAIFRTEQFQRVRQVREEDGCAVYAPIGEGAEHE